MKNYVCTHSIYGRSPIVQHVQARNAREARRLARDAQHAAEMIAYRYSGAAMLNHRKPDPTRLIDWQVCKGAPISK